MPTYSVIDNKHNVEYRCCKEDVSIIFGLSSKQIGRLEKRAKQEKRNREIVNYFEILFVKFKEIKQKKGDISRFNGGLRCHK